MATAPHDTDRYVAEPLLSQEDLALLSKAGLVPGKIPVAPSAPKTDAIIAFDIDDENTATSVEGNNLSTQEFALLSMLQLGWGLFVNPFFVGRTLCQVQYRPSSRFLRSLGVDDIRTRPPQFDSGNAQLGDDDLYEHDLEDDDVGVEDFDIDDDDGDHSPETHRQTRVPRGRPRGDAGNVPAESFVLTRSGYLVPRTLNADDPARPSYQLPLASDPGPFTLCRQLIGHTGEGFLSLFKGSSYASAEVVVRDLLALEIRIGKWLSLLMPSWLRSWRSLPLFRDMSAIFALGCVSSPLDYLCTRSILRPRTMPSNRSFLDLAVESVSEMIFAPVTLLKGVEYMLDIVSSSAFSTCIEEFAVVRAGPEGGALLTAAVVLALVDAAVLTPIATVRQRLLAQHVVAARRRRVIPRSVLPRRRRDVKNDDSDDDYAVDTRGVPTTAEYAARVERFRPIVALSPVPYTGPLDCARRMVIEEGAGSLFYGFGMRFSSYAVVVVLQLLSSMRGSA